MNTIIRTAAVLVLAATFGAPLTAYAQSDVPLQPPPGQGMGEHHHGHRMRDPFIRALHKLNLSDDQKKQIKSDITATMKANQNATPDQRKASREALHKQIEALLTPAQNQQLKAELAKERAMWKAHKDQMQPEPAST